MNNRTNKIVKLGFFLALAVLLHYVESLFPLDSILPGVKLGLANAVGLMVLAFYGVKDYISFGFLRVLIVGLLSSGLFSVAFFLSLSGMILSMAMTLVVYKLTKSSILGLSVVGSLFHGFGQVLMICVIYQNVYMLTYLPVLMVGNFFTGIILAEIMALVLKRIPEAIYVKYHAKGSNN